MVRGLATLVAARQDPQVSQQVVGLPILPLHLIDALGNQKSRVAAAADRFHYDDLP
jgi:hypothetical protein